MDKQSLIRDMKSAFGSAFITRQQLSQYMGYWKNSVMS